MNLQMLPVSDGQTSRHTEILKRPRGGDSAAAADLLELVYDRLRRLAAGYVKRRNPRQTLQTMDIVHEAYNHLVDGKDVEWEDRTHFIGVAVCAMRQVMVEYARPTLVSQERLRFRPFTSHRWPLRVVILR